jgi:hypothetical protein
MISKRSLVSVALLALVGGITGCKEDAPAPKPEPAASASSNTLRNPRGRLNLRTPMAPMAKIDPQALKEYRADVCYFGTLSLRQARDAYFASLGKDEPSEKKLPSFGGAPPAATPASAAKTPTGAPKPPTAAAPKATASAAAKAAPAGSADAKRAARTDRGRRDLTMRAPYERNARACIVAANVKEPAMGDVDAALAAFAPYALDLAKTIATASGYYQREEYKQDKLAKGKELHKQLVEKFAKLDELEEKLGASIEAWRKAHAVEPAKLDEGEKDARAAVDEARLGVLALLEKKVDPAAYKTHLDALDKAIEALKTFGAAHPADAWAKVLVPSLEAFAKTAKDLKVTDKGVTADELLSVSTGFTSVIEANERALSRSLVAKGQTNEAARPAAAAPAASAAPTAKP